MQIFKHSLDELGTAALLVEIFIPKNERTIRPAGALVGGPECTGMA
jgi:hypothetical protein